MGRKSNSPGALLAAMRTTFGDAELQRANAASVLNARDGKLRGDTGREKS
jgi:hypothetical protein